MAEAITIICPECEKKMTVPADAVGKKVRCKGCQHVFAVTAPADKKAPPAPKVKPAKSKPKPTDEDEEDDTPIGVTALDTAPRCPNCANEMESEEAVICLTCGYNTRTRIRVETKAVEDTTFMTWFWWLLPGILCALFFIILLTFDILYTIKIDNYVDKENDWYAFVAAGFFKIWFIWAPTTFLNVGLLTFAVRRLVLHPKPPERVKKKPKQDEE
jgi:DNA-directed RNA polymerase subunit M/transcription elongation factor TFIIS